MKAPNEIFIEHKSELKERNAGLKNGMFKSTKTFHYVDLSNISIPEYQRPVDNNKVCKIIANFNPNRVSPKLLSYRDGQLWVVDGLQTFNALKKLAEQGRINPIMACEIISDLTYEEEVNLFIEQYENCARAKAVEMFRASVIAQIPWAVELNNLIKNLGLTAVRSTKKSRKNINAMGKILQIYRNSGIEGVKLALSLIIDSSYVEFDGGLGVMMLEIGGAAAKLGIKHLDDNYFKILNKMKELGNPDAFDGESRTLFPNNKGQHGEDPIKMYVKYILGLIDCTGKVIGVAND